MRDKGLFRLLALGGLAVLAACTAKPVPPLKVTPPVATAVPAAPRIEMRLYADEAPALGAYAGYARREGGKLVISYDGHDVVRLTSSPATDCEGWETCSLWRFAGLIGLEDHGVIQPFAVVSREHGEGLQTIVIDRQGRLEWSSGKLLPSADGRFVASGETASMLGDGFLQVIEWPYPRATYQSFSPCEPKAWVSAGVLKLSCADDDEGKAVFGATMTWNNGTGWKITADNPADSGRLKPVTLKVMSAKQVRDLAAWETAKGVEHLN